jgi:hypothetical protein
LQEEGERGRASERQDGACAREIVSERVRRERESERVREIEYVFLLNIILYKSEPDMPAAFPTASCI